MSGAFRSTQRRPDPSVRGGSPGPLGHGYVQRQPSANDNGTRRPAWGSAFPPDTRAIIEPVRLLDHRARRKLRDQWRLRFEPRAPAFADPLTGWTGGSDPLAHVELRFPNAEAAGGYCMRQGLPCAVRALPEGHQSTSCQW
ncbi:NADH dehydrogenase ubiquinone Fe-S protein 4 [Sphingomonas sp. dw_22]|uniref:NADH dehydrogenase ubiquinone Fe-S protein 4 n=1 Tax=Sphingomonas sp. dw_22 TaxID=2721175 RepID=UPI001BD66281|nr:NADH dehydrogenase ubiquinone Fe-S protein 4 [Sphingomonas sp. dw_22]